MTKIAILPLKEMPSKGCRDCPVNALDFCMILDEEVPSIISSSNKFHPNCPLIEIDIDEVKKSISRIETYQDMGISIDEMYIEDMNTIKSTIDKLGVK